VAVERTGKTVMDRGVERDVVLLSVGAGQRVHADTILAVAVTDLGALLWDLNRVDTFAPSSIAKY
jgi:hypothetical protein